MGATESLAQKLRDSSELIDVNRPLTFQSNDNILPSQRQRTTRKRTVYKPSAKLRAARRKIAERDEKIERLETELARRDDRYWENKAQIGVVVNREIRKQAIMRGTSHQFKQPEWDATFGRQDRHKLMLQDFVASQMKLATELISEGDRLMGEYQRGTDKSWVMGTMCAKRNVPEIVEQKWKQGLALKQKTEWIAASGLGFSVDRDGTVGDFSEDGEDEDDMNDE